MSTGWERNTMLRMRCVFFSSAVSLSDQDDDTDNSSSPHRTRTDTKSVVSPPPSFVAVVLTWSLLPQPGTLRQVKNEQEIFELLGMPYLKPEEREYRIWKDKYTAAGAFFFVPFPFSRFFPSNLDLLFPAGPSRPLALPYRCSGS
jgi:hypothetical protein